MRVYKIRNKASGLFSTGGTYRYKIWSKFGKHWQKNHLNAHLALVRQRNCSPYGNDPLEIVEYELHEVSNTNLVI